LDSNGLGLISFRFVTSSGESISLQNFDSNNNDLHNDNDIAYKVNSQFELQELGSPQEDDFYYGNTISLKFRIRDIVAGSLLSNGRSSKAFLYLTQSDGNTEFVSTKKEAVSNTEDEFEIDWLINVNSIPGKGKVAIVVADLEGSEKVNFGQLSMSISAVLLIPNLNHTSLLLLFHKKLPSWLNSLFLVKTKF